MGEGGGGRVRKEERGGRRRRERGEGWRERVGEGREAGRQASGGRQGGGGRGGRVAKGVHRPSTFAGLLVFQYVLERCRFVSDFIGKFIFAIVFMGFFRFCGCECSSFSLF